jgi:cell wall-associated NlpC family hydrolase
VNRALRLLTLTLGLCLALSATRLRAQEADAVPAWDAARTAETVVPAPARTVRDRASDLVLAALHFIDVPYRRGGSGEHGFDCSGFTRHIFDVAMGLVLPRRADDQARAPQLREVHREHLQPGDLVFFNTLQRTFSHVGIYVGDGRFIHAPRTGSAVRIESMSSAYWARRYTGARRPAAAEAPGAAAVPVVMP